MTLGEKDKLDGYI